MVSPGGVGFDIACGVRLIRSDLDWERDVKPRIGELVRTLGLRVPRGTGKGGRLHLDRTAMEQVLAEGVRYALAVGIGVEEDAELCEDGGVLQTAEPEQVSDRAKDRGGNQLGSLGAGNHFLDELIYLVDARGARIAATTVRFDTATRLRARVTWTPSDEPLEGTELKAATLHQLSLEERADGYEATVFFDV